MDYLPDKIKIESQKSVGHTKTGSRLRKHRFKVCGYLTSASVLFLFEAQVEVQAQTTQVDRAQALQIQTQPPFGPSTMPEGTEDGHAAASPNDADLGEQQILKRAPEYQPLTFSFGCPIFYTSNVALTPNNEKSDLIIAPVASAFYDPRITQTLYGHFGAREQVFNYSDNHEFDFGSLDVEAGFSYFLPQFHNLVLRGEYDFNRLTLDDQLGEEFFSNHQLIFNAELPFRINRAQQVSLGSDANISVGADHQSPRRNDYEGYISYSANLTRAFSINAAGRVVARVYHQNGRTDASEIVSLTATYRLTNWCSVSAISSFAHSDSNQDVFDYNVANVGGAVALSAKF
jgi:Putative beta-barrel porin 2